MSGIHRVAELYTKAFEQHGRSSASVLCPKGRHNSRFDALTAPFSLNGKRLLDFGCGLGHLCAYLDERNIDCDYVGVDIVTEFIESNRLAYPKRRFERIGEIADVKESFDIVLASGVFNLSYFDDAQVNQTYVEAAIEVLFAHAREGLSIDFMTSHVDFQQADAAHFDPGTMIDFATRRLSRRVIMNHSYLPYEFCVSVFRQAEIERKQGVYV